MNNVVIFPYTGFCPYINTSRTVDIEYFKIHKSMSTQPGYKRKIYCAEKKQTVRILTPGTVALYIRKLNVFNLFYLKDLCSYVLLWDIFFLTSQNHISLHTGILHMVFQNPLFLLYGKGPRKLLCVESCSLPLF